MDESIPDLLLRLENEQHEYYKVPWDFNFVHPTLGTKMPELLARAIEFAHIHPAEDGWWLDYQSPAHYRMSTDTIMIPRPMHFKTLDAFAGVLTHELGHWTMDRVGRQDHNVYIEELIAEITSRAVLKHFGYDRSKWSDDYLRMQLNDMRIHTIAPRRETLYDTVEREVNLATQCLLHHFGDYHKEKENEHAFDGTAAGGPA